jgi:hypothetical protein
MMTELCHLWGGRVRYFISPARNGLAPAALEELVPGGVYPQPPYPVTHPAIRTPGAPQRQGLLFVCCARTQKAPPGAESHQGTESGDRHPTRVDHPKDDENCAIRFGSTRHQVVDLEHHR